MVGRTSTRRWGPGLVLLLYVGASVLAPLLHSEREALWTETSVEAQHTSKCLVIHSDAACASLADVPMPPRGNGGPTWAALDERTLAHVPVDRPTGLPPLLLYRTRAPPYSAT